MTWKYSVGVQKKKKILHMLQGYSECWVGGLERGLEPELLEEWTPGVTAESAVILSGLLSRGEHSFVFYFVKLDLFSLSSQPACSTELMMCRSWLLGIYNVLYLELSAGQMCFMNWKDKRLEGKNQSLWCMLSQLGGWNEYRHIHSLRLQLLASLRQWFSDYLGCVTQILSGSNMRPKFSLS